MLRRLTCITLVLPALLGAQQVASNRGTPPIASSANGEPVAARASATIASAARARQAPTIDGRDDDAAWRDAQVIDQFLEYDPNPGAETRFKTEARVLYDDKALYVVVRMFDPAPDSIVSLLSRRDVRTASEQIKLMIDSYHDRRTGFEFCLNPAGVKRDFYVYNDNNEDVTWDGVWDGVARVDSTGWVAEFRIPFSQLRFPKVPEHTFGLMIVRDVARTGARISWPLYRRDRQGYISQAGELNGLTALPSPRRLEVAPYVVAKNVTQARVGGAAGFTHPQQTTLGADVKYGLTSNLTLDATVNPDFGQVEADPSVLNLSAFEQFYDERRPFFLEGAGIFNFRTSCQDIDSGCTGLFYSRRIGRAPQLAGQFGDAASPAFTPIAAATKLTGRLGSGLSVGVLDAVTGRENGPDGAIIEPRTNYFVGRLLQDLRQGQSGIGVMVTAVDRALDPTAAQYLRRSAYVGGVDFRHRFYKKYYELHAMAAGSTVRGSEQSIAALQRDGVHRYQRPDAGLDYDTTRTSLGGNAQRLTLSKFGGGHTRFQSLYQRYSAGFESNDLGFQSRADWQLMHNWFALTFQKPKWFYRSVQMNYNLHNEWSAGGLPTSIGVNTNYHVQFKNTNWIHIGGNWNDFTATYSDRMARGGPAVRKSPSVNFWSGWNGDSRRVVTPTFWMGGFRGDEGRSSDFWMNPGVDLRLASRFSTSFSLNVDRSINDAQWVANLGAIGADTTHYTFARLDQTTVNMSARVNFTVSPTLSFQSYVAPFVSTGSYSDRKQLTNPRAARYADRFASYPGGPEGFDFKQVNANAVLRWEYRPGSTMFVVWQHARSGYVDTASRFDFGRDYGDLWSIHPNNTFLVKLSYWLNP
ncbi:hypothetical protein J421_0240 [Gemmatirosa kalamazoonensis]|uniref:Membrane associated hydrolase n=1 Tax=Gemmatirosa kalamazoonensis TaxID=861299 RepID=W0RBF0_9BACT|nr:DUF5916 domain-containing protein [Gemmatirosa kalamazoonensis]AHG87777.1 hypothetical protein J421_0240 [Gemmatirosa kalamazoonensis]